MKRPLLASWLLIASAWTSSAAAQAVVTIDVTADVHPISPLIYGQNFPSASQLDDGKLTAMRWGGNSTSRYNYEIDTTNTGFDYYFENIPGCWGNEGSWCSSPPADPKESSGANAFLANAKARNVVALFTIPTIGWVAKPPPKYGHPFDCGCPRTANGSQDSYDPYDTNCGNGQSGGQWISCPAPTTTSVAVDATWAGEWAAYLVSKFGPSNGTRVYALDNEPNLWSSTHHDVHPSALTYDELWQKMRDTAVAILDADPTAEIAGPAEWGWPNYFCSDADHVSQGCFPTSPDRAAHGGVDLTSWLLQQAQSYEQQHGRRILHYLDLHYYPQGGDPPAITRSLWDPSYTDPSWINDKIMLIPRMRAWVADSYPGTKTAVSEFDFYHHNEAIGAVTYAEVLGIFGREGLDMATAWSPPAPSDIAFAAYRLFRNYDGAGSGFENASVRATVSSSSTLQAYAAASATRLTVALINEASSGQSVDVALGTFQAGPAAKLYVSSGANIVAQADAVVQSGEVQVTLPATSIAMLVVDGTNPNAPDGGTGGAGGTAGAGGSGGSGAGGSGVDGGSGAGGSAGSGAVGGAGGSSPGGSGGAESGGSGPAGSGGLDAGLGGTGGNAAAPVDNSEASGCACRGVSGRSNALGAAALAVLAAVVMRRRRQVRAAPSRQR